MIKNSLNHGEFFINISGNFLLPIYLKNLVEKKPTLTYTIIIEHMLILQRGNVIYFIDENWIFVCLYLISTMILLCKIVLICTIIIKLLKLVVYCIEIIKLEAIIEDDYQAYKSTYTWTYKFSKSKFFGYIYQQFSEIRQKYQKYMKHNSKSKLEGKKGKLFGYRGGHKDISQILTIVVESQYTKTGRIRSVQTKLKLLINDQVLAKFCAKLGILVFSTTSTLVPRIVGVVIGTNVLLQPIDDEKLLSTLNPTPAFVERIVENRSKVFIQTSPEQKLFLPDPRGTNQVTIALLDSKYKLMCPPEATVTSKNKYVPLSERTKTLQDIVRDIVRVNQDAELILENLDPQVKQKRLNIFIDER